MSTNDITIKKFMDVLDTHFQDSMIEEPFEIGEITSLSPLTIVVKGLPLYESNLYMNKYLLAWDEMVTMTYSDKTTQTITITHPSKLQVGYYVSLYGLEWDEAGKSYQKYNVINVIN